MLTFNGPFLKVLKYPNKTVSIEAMPGVCPGGGIGSFGIEWYITWGAKLLRNDRKAFKGTVIFELFSNEALKTNTM